MRIQSIRWLATAALLTLGALSWADEAADGSDDAKTRGQYLTNILGCGGCHTEGALLGEPTGPWLAGSSIGVAYAEDDDGLASGVAFPGNLTGDKRTGLGDWSEQDIVHFLTTGERHLAPRAIPLMPWPNYGQLKSRDLLDIATYLKSLPAVKKKFPAVSNPARRLKSLTSVSAFTSTRRKLKPNKNSPAKGNTMSTYNTILAAIDLTDEADEVLAAAHKAAKSDGATLHAVTVMQPLQYAYSGYEMAGAFPNAGKLESQANQSAEAFFSHPRRTV